MTKFIDVTEAREYADEIRKAGVRRGINACIETLEKLRSLHNKRSSGYNDLTHAINNLMALKIDEVEG